MIFCDTTYKSGCLSRYSWGLRELFTTFRGAPPKGLYHETDLTRVVGLDQVKCFSYHMYKFKRLPVFSVFDVPLEYDGHAIEPYTLYHWKGGCSFGQFIDWDTVKRSKIISFVRPSRIRKNMLGAQIEKVMENEALPESVRKGILNKVIGWIGKTNNTRQRVELFESELEARRVEKRTIRRGCL